MWPYKRDGLGRGNLIRGMAFGRGDLIRWMAFGRSDLIRGMVLVGVAL